MRGSTTRRARDEPPVRRGDALGRPDGYSTFSLGMAPLSGLGSGGDASWWERAGTWLWERGERFYNFRGLRQFKERSTRAGSPATSPRRAARPCRRRCSTSRPSSGGGVTGMLTRAGSSTAHRRRQLRQTPSDLGRLLALCGAPVVRRTHAPHPDPTALAVSLLATPTLAPAQADVLPRAWGAVTSRVSVAADGGQSTGPTYCCASISGHGRFVAFESEAADVVRGDTKPGGRRLRPGPPRRRDAAGQRLLGGASGDGPSVLPTISDDGRFVAFTSRATNLVPGDTNGAADVFVRDLRAGDDPAHLGDDGRRAGDGRQLRRRPQRGRAHGGLRQRGERSCRATPTPPGRLRPRPRRRGDTARLGVDDEKQANERSLAPELSADGRFVAFTSVADNLVANDRNGGGDLFLRDRLTGRTTLVNLGPGGVQGRPTSDFHAPFAEAVSTDGRFVSFSTDQSGLVPDDTNGAEDIYVRDTVARRTERVSTTADGRELSAGALAGAMSGDGRLVMFWALQDGVVPGDTNGNDDLFVRDRLAGTTRLLSVGVGGRGAKRLRRRRRRLDRRPAHRLLLLRLQPRPGRHERRGGRLRPGRTRSAAEPSGTAWWPGQGRDPVGRAGLLDPRQLVGGGAPRRTVIVAPSCQGQLVQPP